MPKKQVLGKGLDIIFSDNSPESSPGVVYLRLSDIEPKPDQPRKFFDNEALTQLADSIAVHGVLQPILVREADTGYYQIIAGERRWRASKLAGLSEIPAIIMEADALQAAQVALIENLQREDLNAYEEAQAFSELLNEYGLTQEEIATRLGKSRSAVANALRLLDLPEEIVALLKEEKLSAGHCRALLGLRDKVQLLPLANKIMHRNLSVRETETLVKSANKRRDDDIGEKHFSVNYYEDLERRATVLLGRRCRISGGKGRHVVQVEYTDNEDLESILRILCGNDIIEKE